MKTLAIILNIFLPGVGTLVAGKIGIGIVQLLILAIAGGVSITGVGIIAGGPIAFLNWIWALYTVAKMK
ncbi:hypothetical protein KR51_00013730 [Rubidibacter lacunae KORDI 51-2]|uniref:TM2 domain protein n=1 Tax=Rubidibacter lacunae KORDI 51-2 TaxID=582515 RepID=U5DBY2_9CHRO|nr:hypothetical protein [Rubidibacter lacunae]ERN42038.1 hypothetical protein KR51_00013730 [Rubidibacter lacunae KORDI 51-2]